MPKSKSTLAKTCIACWVNELKITLDWNLQFNNLDTGRRLRIVENEQIRCLAI